MLDYDGEIKKRGPPQQMDIIHQNNFFDISALDFIRFSGEDYEKSVNSLIPSSYVRNPQDG